MSTIRYDCCCYAIELHTNNYNILIVQIVKKKIRTCPKDRCKKLTPAQATERHLLVLDAVFGVVTGLKRRWRELLLLQ
jgi:hypothetical protein